jgi:hypothetical protein
MGIITAIAKVSLAALKLKRAAKRSRKHFQKELVRQGIDKKVAVMLADEYEVQSNPSIGGFLRSATIR